MGENKLQGYETISDVHINHIHKQDFDPLGYLQRLMCRAYFDGSNSGKEEQNCNRNCSDCLFGRYNLDKFKEEIRERVSELR